MILSLKTLQLSWGDTLFIEKYLSSAFRNRNIELSLILYRDKLSLPVLNYFYFIFKFNLILADYWNLNLKLFNSINYL